MSQTPIFDETLADAPVNIWQAGSCFPIPTDISCAVVPPEYFAKGGYCGPATLIDPANLSFLRSVA